jgi:hypothetical protein
LRLSKKSETLEETDDEIVSLDNNNTNKNDADTDKEDILKKILKSSPEKDTESITPTPTSTSDNKIDPNSPKKIKKRFALKSTAPIASKYLVHKKIDEKANSPSFNNNNNLFNPEDNSQTNNRNGLNKNEIILNNSSQVTRMVNQNVGTTNYQLTTTTTPPLKQFKNKIVSCKPFCHSKLIDCRPIVRDASTQIDLDDIKINHTVVPVPVPITVPLPLCMYSAPMPLPIFIPIPIPIPIFIPTTKKTFDRVERRINVKLKNCFLIFKFKKDRS